MPSETIASRKVIEELKQSIKIFLESEPEIRAFAEDISQIGEVAIFGGVPRDLSRNVHMRPEADVDLVVDCKPKDLEHYLITFQTKMNKFGGFRTQIGRRFCDVWAASQTWAVKHGHCNLDSFDDIANTTFFSCDQVLYNVNRDYIHATEAFLIWHERNVVSLNLPENPNHQGIAGRIVRILNDWEHAVDRNIVHFFTQTIEEQLRSQDFDALPDNWTDIYQQAKEFEVRSQDLVFFYRRQRHKADTL